MDRWVSKVAVVTGASSGIGREIAHTLADKGMIVVGLARRKERLEELAAQSKGKIYPIKCDVTKENEILEAFAWIEKTLGGVDVLVNNAGVVNMASLISGKTDEWRNVINVNLVALCICTREALRTMRKRGDNGHIIHINSILGHSCVQYDNVPIGIYQATKHGITALTESLRVELRGVKSQIRVTSISPGIVQTELVDKGVLEVCALENVDTRFHNMYAFSIDVKDISEAVTYALSTKPTVQVHELMLQPVGQRIA